MANSGSFAPKNLNPFHFPNLSSQVKGIGGQYGLWPTPSDDSSIVVSSTGTFLVREQALVAQRLVHNSSGRLNHDWRPNHSVITVSKLDLVSMGLSHTVQINNILGIDAFSLEDPRLNFRDEKLELWCCAVGHSDGRVKMRQVILELGHDLQIEAIKYPKFGRNEMGGPEKNWCPIEGTANFVYQSEGEHIIFNHLTGDQFTSEGIAWSFGEVHGGTPAVLVGDQYLSFFQSSLTVDPSVMGTSECYPRQYFVGAYTFESVPPFQITQVSKEPLLFGTGLEPTIIGSAIIVFPAGLIFDATRDNLLLTVGVNDCRSGYIRLPRASVFSRLTPVA